MPMFTSHFFILEGCSLTETVKFKFLPNYPSQDHRNHWLGRGVFGNHISSLSSNANRERTRVLGWLGFAGMATIRDSPLCLIIDDLYSQHFGLFSFTNKLYLKYTINQYLILYKIRIYQVYLIGLVYFAIKVIKLVLLSSQIYRFNFYFRHLKYIS